MYNFHFKELKIYHYLNSHSTILVIFSLKSVYNTFKISLFSTFECLIKWFFLLPIRKEKIIHEWETGFLIKKIKLISSLKSEIAIFAYLLLISVIFVDVIIQNINDLEKANKKIMAWESFIHDIFIHTHFRNMKICRRAYT